MCRGTVQVKIMGRGFIGLCDSSCITLHAVIRGNTKLKEKIVKDDSVCIQN